MKKILLTSLTTLSLLSTITASAAFSNGDLKGTYGYNLEGQGGENFIFLFIDTEGFPLGVSNGNFPNFITEVGVFKANGLDNILITGKSAVRVNDLLGIFGEETEGARILNFDTTYTCNPYTINFQGRGTVECTRTDTVPPIPGEQPVEFTRTVLIEFVIDDHNREVRLFEKQIGLESAQCFEEPLAMQVTLDSNGKSSAKQIPINRDPFCFLLLEGSARKQVPNTFPHQS